LVPPPFAPRDATSAPGDVSVAGHRPRLWTTTVVIASFLALATLANLPAWLHGPSRSLPALGGPGTGDPAQEVWFLGFVQNAVFHGHNPFFTTLLNYPHGVNLMANTSILLPGLLMAPVTALWGPVASFNVLLVVGFACSATAAYLVFGRWIRWLPAAYAGGLLYGFSAFAVGQGRGHLFLVFAPFPPLLVMALDEILVRQRSSATRWGIGLGLLCAAQLLISTEVLADSVVLAVIGIALVAWVCRDRVRAHIGYAARALSLAAVVFLTVCAYPLYMLFFGPERTTGRQHGAADLSSLSADVGSQITVTSLQHFGNFSAKAVGDALVASNLTENGAYLGIIFVFVLVLIAVRHRRRPIVQFSVALALVAIVLSWGPRLTVDGYRTSIPLPMALLWKFPLLNSSVPIRFSLFVMLFAGLLLAVGLDEIRAMNVSRIPGAWAAAAVGTVALLPLIPAWPYPMTAVAVPHLFGLAVSPVPAGSVVLTQPVPLPHQPNSQAMLWQAVDGMRYQMIGGYAFTPGTKGVASAPASSMLTVALLQACWAGAHVEPTPHTIILVRDQLRLTHVGVIAVEEEVGNPGCTTHLLTTVLGRPPIDTEGVGLWTGVQGDVQGGRTEAGSA